MNENMQELENDADSASMALDELDKLAQAGDIDPSKLDPFKGQLQKLDLDLDDLSDRLMRLQAKKKIQGKLKMLGKKLGKCQGCVAGQCDSPFANPGGKNPGTGTIDSRRDQQDALVDNGQIAQQKGLKGRGPSETQVQTASEGTGVSRRQAEETERKFDKQLESFVQREDVPEDVKDGVREYFTNIHQNTNDQDTK